MSRISYFIPKCLRIECAESKLSGYCTRFKDTTVRDREIKDKEIIYM